MIEAAPDAATLEQWLRRREVGEPLAWITGWTLFTGRRVLVDRGVYVPRRQSEELAVRAAAVLPQSGRALDLCTGAGAVAVALRHAAPRATVIGADIDPVAASCARRNGVTVYLGDLAEPIGGRCLDVVTAVAPYVPTGELRLLPADVQRYEPLIALDGGQDGLDLVRQVVEAAGSRLGPGGWLLIEVGGEQDRALAPVLANAGFDRVERWSDDDGDLRGLAARRGDLAPNP